MLPLDFWIGLAGAERSLFLECKFWLSISGVGLLDWEPGFGFLARVFWSWREVLDFEFLGLECWVGVHGFQLLILGLLVWDVQFWVSSLGLLHLNSWPQTPGFRFLALGSSIANLALAS